MAQRYVQLPNLGCPAILAPLCGGDEMKVVDVSTRSAISLLSSITHDERGEPIDALELTAGERDRLLGRLWQEIFGDEVQSTVRCRACEERFDVDFLLSDLLGSVFSDDQFAPNDQAPRVVQVLGCTARLPRGKEELAIAGMDKRSAAKYLSERCIVDGECEDPVVFVEALGELEPVVNLKLAAKCPECGEEQSIGFDLQQYVMTALVEQREHVLIELHSLASAYGWSSAEILDLSRRDRKTLARLISQSASRRRR